MIPLKHVKVYQPLPIQKTEHDQAIHRYGMHGGWHTRMRLTSTPQGDLGHWEYLDNVRGIKEMDTWALYDLAAVLPPECVALGGRKMRSPFRGVGLSDLLLAAPRDPVYWYRIDKPAMRALLCRPPSEIKDLAVLAALDRVVQR